MNNQVEQRQRDDIRQILETARKHCRRGLELTARMKAAFLAALQRNIHKVHEIMRDLMLRVEEVALWRHDEKVVNELNGLLAA